MGVRLQEREGKGWYVIINWKGQRRTKFFGKHKALAKDFREKIDAKLKLGSVGISTKAGQTLEAYAVTWLERLQHTRKASTCEDYGKRLRRDIVPLLKGIDLEEITREKVKALAFAGLRKGVQNVVRCLSSLLSHAKEDGLIRENTALNPGKFLPKMSRRKFINPFSRGEVSTFLETVQAKAPRYSPLFLCAVRTGLRQSELLALQWGDIDYHGRFIEVQRNYARGQITTPKNGESRRVNMSKELTQALRDLQTERQLEAAANGWREVFASLLKASGLRRIRFHELRHTFASLLLQQGESPVYVKEQMGHSSIQVTVDLYGHLIPGGNKQAVDRLDSEVLKPAKSEKSCVSLVTQSEQGRFWGAGGLESVCSTQRDMRVFEKNATQAPPRRTQNGATHAEVVE